MIEILERSTIDCLAVRFSGKVTGPEYQQFLQAVQGCLERSPKLNLVCELIDFDLYGDLEAAKADIKFGFNDYTNIRRAAFVGDQKWIDWFFRLIGPFTQAEEKYFPTGQTEAAYVWASARE